MVPQVRQTRRLGVEPFVFFSSSVGRDEHMGGGLIENVA
jgi:hypothetical protein